MKDKVNRSEVLIIECEQGTGMSLCGLYLAYLTAKMENKRIIQNFKLSSRFTYLDFESADTLIRRIDGKKS